MKIRIISIILALLMILPMALGASAAASNELIQRADVDGDGIISAKDSAIIARYVAHWDGYSFDDGSISFPNNKKITKFSTDTKVDFKGREFKFITESTSVEHFKITEIMPQGDITPHFQLESKAVAERNKYLEEKYNCKITCQFISGCHDVLKADVLAGTADYDIAYILASEMYYLGGVGTFCDLASIPTIDLSADYYNQKLNRQLSVGNKTFYLFGDASSSILKTAYALVANATAIKNYANEDIVDLVLNGKWTLDKMYQISQNAYANGISSNKVKKGFIAENGTQKNFFYGAGGSFATKNINGYAEFVPSISKDSDQYKVIEAMKKVLTGEFRQVGDRSSAGCYDEFAFYLMNMGHNSYGYTGGANNIALIPLPKMNEQQLDYRTLCNAGTLKGYVIPFNAKQIDDAADYGFRNGTEMIGFFLNAFFEASKNHTGKSYSVLGAYTEEVMSRSPYNKIPENRQLIGIIYDSLGFQLEEVYNYSGIASLVNTYTTIDNYKNCENIIGSYNSTLSLYSGSMAADQKSYTND